MRIIKLEGTNCKYCKDVGDFLNINGVPHESINLDQHPKIGAKYGAMSVPVTILLDDNDQEIDRVFGVKIDQLEELIDKL